MCTCTVAKKREGSVEADQWESLQSSDSNVWKKCAHSDNPACERGLVSVWGEEWQKERQGRGGGESSAFLGVILHKLFEMLEKIVWLWDYHRLVGSHEDPTTELEKPSDT